MKKKKLKKYLNDFLNIEEYKDSSKNGLQVDSSLNKINKIGVAVDCTTYVLQRAIKEEVDGLLVHHGLFWGSESKVQGNYYDILSKLIKNDIALFAYHLPLDGHDKVGNNYGLFKGLTRVCAIDEFEIKDFGAHEDQNLGVGIEFEDELNIGSVLDKYCKNMGLQKQLYNFGDNNYINSVAILSGGGGGWINQAASEGYDLYITGECKHSELIKAKQHNLSLLLGGHWETEKIGVKLLANHLKQKFDLKNVFVDQGPSYKSY